MLRTSVDKESIGGNLALAILLLSSTAIFGYVFWLESTLLFLSIPYAIHAFFLIIFGAIIIFFFGCYSLTPFQFFFPKPDFVSSHGTKVYCQGFHTTCLDFDRILNSLFQQNNQMTGYVAKDLQQYLKRLTVFWMPYPFRVKTTWRKSWRDHANPNILYLSYRRDIRTSELSRMLLGYVVDKKGITWGPAHDEHVKRSNLVGPT